MSSLIKMFAIILIFLVLVVSFCVMFYFSQKKYSGEVLEKRKFSCSEVDFNFEYPVFKKWPNVSVDCEEKNIKIADKDGYSLIRIQTMVGKGIGFMISSDQKNPQGIPYTLSINEKYEEASFMMGDKSGKGAIEVMIFKLPIKQGSLSDFPSRQFLEEVINTFDWKKRM